MPKKVEMKKKATKKPERDEEEPAQRRDEEEDASEGEEAMEDESSQEETNEEEGSAPAKPKRNTLQSRAGITLSAARVAKLAEKNRFQRRMAAKAIIYLTAAADGLVRKIVKSAHEHAVERKRGSLDKSKTTVVTKGDILATSINGFKPLAVS